MRSIVGKSAMTDPRSKGDHAEHGGCLRTDPRSKGDHAKHGGCLRTDPRSKRWSVKIGLKA